MPPRAICSWHDLDELTRSLHLVQNYVETRKGSNLTRKPPAASLLQQNSRKRKSPGSDHVISRDERLGILTPIASSDLSRATSEISVSSSSDGSEGDPDVYNGVLEKKDGWIVAKRVGLTTFLPRHMLRPDSPRILKSCKSIPLPYRLLRCSRKRLAHL